MDELYREIVLDHAGRPRNQGTLAHPTHTLRESNASCGDMVEMQFEVKGGKIVDVRWRGVGCAISTASASMVSEMVKGKTLEEVKKINESDLLKMMGMDQILPTREKCLRLPLRVLEKL